MGTNKTFPINNTELKIFSYLPDTISVGDKKVIARALDKAIWELTNGLNIYEDQAIDYIRRLK